MNKEPETPSSFGELLAVEPCVPHLPRDLDLRWFRI